MQTKAKSAALFSRGIQIAETVSGHTAGSLAGSQMTESGSNPISLETDSEGTAVWWHQSEEQARRIGT
jgi:hypothetical protein